MPASAMLVARLFRLRTPTRQPGNLASFRAGRLPTLLGNQAQASESALASIHLPNSHADLGGLRKRHRLSAETQAGPAA